MVHLLWKEYKAVKMHLMENKAVDPHGFSTEVFKQCDIDDIILEFSNNLLLKNNKLLPYCNFKKYKSKSQ